MEAGPCSSEPGILLSHHRVTAITESGLEEQENLLWGCGMPILVIFLVLGVIFFIMGVMAVSAVVAERRQFEREESAETQHHVAAAK